MRHGQMIAQAKTIALHLGAIPEAMAEVRKRYGDALAPGGPGSGARGAWSEGRPPSGASVSSL
ncbi:hypothetical protein [Variovorax paradoxus]|uniref:hypothetical protein n=1 Tax=Variovorax paradoxus TaxID=34073 RepID=UPI001ABCB34E